MNKDRLISNINSEEVWDWVKYRYASLLLHRFYGEDVIEFIKSKYEDTQDNTYLKILEGKVEHLS